MVVMDEQLGQVIDSVMNLMGSSGWWDRCLRVCRQLRQANTGGVGTGLFAGKAGLEQLFARDWLVLLGRWVCLVL